MFKFFPTSQKKWVAYSLLWICFAIIAFFESLDPFISKYHSLFWTVLGNFWFAHLGIDSETKLQHHMRHCPSSYQKYVLSMFPDVRKRNWVLGPECSFDSCAVISYSLDTSFQIVLFKTVMFFIVSTIMARAYEKEKFFSYFPASGYFHSYAVAYYDMISNGRVPELVVIALVVDALSSSNYIERSNFRLFVLLMGFMTWLAITNKFIRWMGFPTINRHLDSWLKTMIDCAYVVVIFGLESIAFYFFKAFFDVVMGVYVMNRPMHNIYFQEEEETNLRTEA